MFNCQELLGLSDGGYRDFLRGVRACVLTNLLLLLSFAVIIQAVIVLLEPLLSGAPLNIRQLWLLFGVGAAVVMLYFFAYQNEYRQTYTVSYSESEKIRLEVAEHIRRLPLSFFNNKDLSELTTNIMADCTTIEHVMSHVLPGLCADIIAAGLACGALAFYDWRMALALFAALPLALGLILGGRQIQAKFGERHVQAKLRVSDQVQEYLDGIKVVKAFGLSGEKSRALETALRSMMFEAIKFEGITGTAVTLAMMILQVGLGLVTLVGVLLLLGGSLDIIKLLTFIIISARIYSPLIVVFTLLPELFYFLISTRRMQALRREPLLGGAEDIVLPDYNIELRNVSFAYNNKDVLKNISLKIPQNSVTALVGPSGGGKTTVARLIARFWDVRSGEILIGGQNICGIDPERLLHYMSFVFQDVVLFNDTVMNNIRIGKQDASDAQVCAAAKMARCDEFSQRLPQGYATIIGENGCTLSGGERQRISIARALLKDAPIVLLDEATASLDPENETQIQAALAELVKGRTVIVIAHRLRTVLAADKIAVLDNGRLVEEGSALDLPRDGLFARLYKLQQESLGWSIKR
ncbi:multidrug transport system ATPase and permease components [Candidatus Termititenax persephonae]|uniref:Multidrug transport system ATPase and permease components n=1 Tax=Candidatus Termititenax persephonae TaxID=2218525 RepID=A0A388TE81_9BACT|nr:multidrug transport system ATPase and permease components [Candidatus Termititenax persephonae]